VDTFKVDTEQLRESAKALKLISSEFTDANDNSDALANAVGHAELADHVRNFAHNWDERRKEMLEVIEDLRKTMTDGAETVEEADAGLATSLTQPPAPTISYGGHP
jgi:uncharacterized protein YukE